MGKGEVEGPVLGFLPGVARVRRAACQSNKRALGTLNLACSATPSAFSSVGYSKRPDGRTDDTMMQWTPPLLSALCAALDCLS